jgi:epoxyqueuosine reductase
VEVNMDLEQLTASLYSVICQAGSRGKLVAIKHLSELQLDIERYQNTEIVDQDFYDKELSGFDWEYPEEFSDERSVIITATEQSKSQVSFEFDRHKFLLTIPPTYSYVTDEKIESILKIFLNTAGYTLRKAKLPLKLLSVRSGLAKYGRNNVTYIDQMGSYHRLAAFYTNLPCIEDNWQELELHKSCTKCKACFKACPTGAISSERFLLHAEKCLTFKNEFSGKFPGWIDPKWHNCLVGCLLCQEACPLNSIVKRRVEESYDFSEEESRLILEKTPKKKLPQSTVNKLKELGLEEYLNVLPRNLEVLINKYMVDDLKENVIY